MISPAILSRCKLLPHGDEGMDLMLQRTRVQIANPKDDPLTLRVVEHMRETDFSKFESVLDVGCYGGFLYHFKKPRGYVGIDIYKPAIEAAKTLAPEADFRCEDVLNHEGYYDLVWSSQVNWRGTQKQAFDKMMSLGKKHVFIFVQSEGEVLPREAKSDGVLVCWNDL